MIKLSTRTLRLPRPQGGAELANFVLVVAILGAFVTAFYMTRAVSLTFFGTYKGHGHPHESPRIMTYPLIALAFFSVTAGWINIPGITDFFTKGTEARFLAPGDHHAESINFGLAGLGCRMRPMRSFFRFTGLYTVSPEWSTPE